jgi:dTDP-L-rhamnose 4-epimerase
MGKNIAPAVTGKYRAGDIRHCFADISKAKQLLNFHPEISLEKGFSEYTQWLSLQTANDYVEKAQEELTSRGLAV